MGNHNNTPRNNSSLETVNEHTVSYFEILPPELLQKIFSCLDKREASKVARVCKLFRDYAYAEEAWRKLNLKTEFLQWQNQKKNAKLTSAISLLGRERLCGVKELSLVGCEATLFTSKLLQRIAASFPSLTSLDLTDLSLPPKLMKEIFLHAKFKETLSVLTLNGCVQVNDQIVSEAVSAFPNLTALNLRHCSISVASVASLSTLKKLERLSLEGVVDLNDHYLESLSQNCTQLKSLNLFGALNATAKGVSYLSSNMKNLIDLNLSGTEQLDDACLSGLSKNNQFQKLDFSGCKRITNEGIIELASQCKQLTHLHLFACRGVEDAGIIALATHCQHLTLLNICGCKNVTDNAIFALASLRSLKVLDIALCSKVTDNALKSLANSNIKDSLENLALDYLPKLTDEGFNELNSLKNLKELRLSGCRVTDFTMEMLGPLTSHLNVLYLIDCDSLTDKSILSLISAGCHNMVYLDISHVSAVTNKTMAEFIKNAPSLQELGIKHTALTLDIPLFKQLRPNLKFWC